jgi:hypothetical protein
MGSDSAQVDAEMESFQEWALDIVGLVFKVAKDRLAAREQLALGFIWDSVTLTRTLESRKLESYLALLSEYAGLPTLDLRQMQSMAGKLHRMLMTLPPGSACLAASLFELMSGLKLPWHQRRDAPAARGLHVGARLAVGQPPTGALLRMLTSGPRPRCGPMPLSRRGTRAADG